MPNSFYDLKIWQDARKLMLELYNLTSQFPREEQFNLTSQIRRAGVSVMANIAEGHDRPTHQERIRFFVIPRGSLEEIKSHLSASEALNYINNDKLTKFNEKCIKLAIRINSFIRSLKDQQTKST